MLRFYTGYAYEATALKELDALIADRPSLRVEGNIEGWRHLVLVTQRGLLRENPTDSPPPYEYPLLFYYDADLLIIVAEDKRIVDHVRGVTLGRVLPATVRHAFVDVDQLVNHLLEWSVVENSSHDDAPPYVLSYVHAQTIAFEPQLKSAMFFGDDIGEAGMFRNIRPLLRCAVCGMRPSDGPEVLRVGTDGSLSFALPDRGQRVRLRLTAAAIAYVRGNQFYRYRGGEDATHR
jgi:hypothetical protein